MDLQAKERPQDYKFEFSEKAKGNAKNSKKTSKIVGIIFAFLILGAMTILIKYCLDKRKKA